jgi:serine/threonine protein kinase
VSQDHSTTLSQLLDAALAQPAEQRVAWVDGLAEEFASWKPRLRSLVTRSCRADQRELFDTLPKLERSSAPQVTHFEATAHLPGARIGPYRLQRRLGVGAMAVVWRAERTDGLPPRAVALKFAHAALHRSDLQARLVREQQLMAALDHPNIARLYSAGVTEEGQPYLVLEYVPGLQLHEYCRAQRPGLAARLALFAQICQAVAHAHACQIIHRDLKPANVMVCDDGRVRLLDFGIGKLLSDGLPAELQLSLLSGQPLTPAYASPEQVLGGAAGLASDVYSLGVLLYELLTGERPYVCRLDSNRALRQAIVEVTPPAPSSRGASSWLAEVRALGPQLAAALDAVVLSALKKRPVQRHASAGELSRALEPLVDAIKARAPR